MEFEQALEIVTGAFTRKVARPLTEVEVALLFGAWHNLTYDRIAERSGYTLNYLQRDVGPKFWTLLSQVLERKVSKITFRAVLTHLDQPLPRPSIPPQPLIDWGEAIDVSTFQGRTAELESLTHSIAQARCRLVAIVGMGGIGKSTLAAKVAQQVQSQFEFVIWRSLRNAPPLEDLLSQLIPFLSRQQDIQATPERLLYWLRTHRCLVILDNQETLLQPGEHTGTYQPDFTPYGDLFRLLGESHHRSCILLTSREQSTEVAILEDAEGAVRSLFLKGSWEASLSLLDAKRLVGTDTEKRQLCELYHCNPLALKMVATSIQSLFDGEIAAFFQTETSIFNGMRRLLDRQFDRLSSLEQSIMYWLAINREWTSIADLQADIVPAIARASLLEALESLTRRSFIEKRVSKSQSNRMGEYTQQPVIMEYVIDRLIRQFLNELSTLKIDYFNQYALTKNTVLDYIRESQIRLILQPISEQLKNLFYNDSKQLEQHLRSLLPTLRSVSGSGCDYGIGNFINLCLHLQIALVGYDFSCSTIRHVDLQGATLQHTNFQSAHFIQSTFTQTFTGGIWVRFSPDGERFAIGDTNGKIHIWQFEKMQPLLTIQAHQAWIVAAAWHPDGKTLASGIGPTVRLWDTHTGKWLRNLEYTDCVFTLAWSPDGKYLACAGQEPSILVWDGATGNCLARLGNCEPNHQSCWVWSLVWLDNGAVLAGAYTDHTIKFWDVASGHCIRVIQAHQYWVLSLALHPNGKILASSGMDTAIKLWDWRTGECLQAIATQDYVWRLEWSPDGQRLAGGSDNHTVLLWDCSLQCLQVFQGHQSLVWAVAWSQDGKTLATVSQDHVMKFWNTQTGRCIRTFQGHSNSSWCLRWSKDGVRLLSGNTNHMVQLWNSQTSECLRLFQGHTKEVLFVAWSPDEQRIASCSADSTIRIWNVQTGECLNILTGHQRGVKSVAWSQDGHYVISSSNDQTIRFWNIYTGECLFTLSDHHHQVNSVVCFPFGHRAVSSSSDKTIRFWDLHRRVCDRVIMEQHPVHSLVFSPNGKTFASGDYASTIKLWDVNGNCLQTFQGHAPGHIYSLAWSPDSQQIVSICTDSTIRIWNVNSGECEQVIEGKNWGMSVDWNPINPCLAISYFEQPIQIWNVETSKPVKNFKSQLLYAGMNIAGVTGISEGQKVNLKALGAIEV